MCLRGLLTLFVNGKTFAMLILKSFNPQLCHRVHAHISLGTHSAASGLQAARQLRTNLHSVVRELRRAGRLVMRAVAHGIHAPQLDAAKECASMAFGRAIATGIY